MKKIIVTAVAVLATALPALADWQVWENRGSFHHSSGRETIVTPSGIRTRGFDNWREQHSRSTRGEVSTPSGPVRFERGTAWGSYHDLRWERSFDFPQSQN